MPVPRVAMGEHPADFVEGEARVDVRVLSYILLIVEINELVLKSTGINREGNDGQPKANQKICTGEKRFRRAARLGPSLFSRR